MRLVIFDLDGTLIDSEALIVETITEAFKAVNEPVPDERAIRSISGITARDAMARSSRSDEAVPISPPPCSHARSRRRRSRCGKTSRDA